MSIEQGNNEFTIPFSRQQLADYLSVDRSALSGELSKMQRDGLIEFRKSDFTLLEDSYLYECLLNSEVLLGKLHILHYFHSA